MASPSPETTYPHHSSSRREAQSGGLQAAARPTSGFAIPAARKGSSTETNENPKTPPNLDAGNPSIEIDLISAHRARQEISQSYISPPTQDHMDRPEPDPNLSLSHDLPQQTLPYASTSSSHNHSSDDDDRMRSDDESYPTLKTTPRARLPTPVYTGNTSATCCSTPRTTDNTPADETDCEHAARIIASMRGHGDHESLWPELGCSLEKKCMIKNIRLFQMA